MGGSHFEKWASGFLGVICLLLSANLVREFREGRALLNRPRRVIATRSAKCLAGALTPQTSKQSSQARLRPRSAEAGKRVTSSQTLRKALQPAAASPAASPPRKAPPERSAEATPRSITLKPLGYVEKADGRLQAIIDYEDGVQLVAEGQTLADNSRVVRVTTQSVEIVREAPRQAPELASARPVSLPSPPTAGHPSPLATGEQDSASSASTISAGLPDPAAPGAKPLGYVERYDGRVETIVAKGEHVALVEEPTIVADDALRAKAPGTKPGNASEPSSPTYGVLPHAASGSESSQAKVLTAQAPGSPSPQAQTRPAESQPESSLAVSAAGPEPVTSGVAVQVAVSSTSLTPVGFVEWAGGRRQAVIEDGEDISLVQEGQTWAGNLEVVTVSPTVVELAPRSTGPPGSEMAIAELPYRRPTPWAAAMRVALAQPNRPADAGIADRFRKEHRGGQLRSAPASRWRAPPSANRGPPGAAMLCVSASKPLAGMKATRDAVSSAPIAVRPLGHVEWADGRKAAIVADGEWVCLLEEDEAPHASVHLATLSLSGPEIGKAPSPQAAPTAEWRSGVGVGAEPAGEHGTTANHAPPGTGPPNALPLSSAAAVRQPTGGALTTRF
jgi:hypothetical protein